MNRPRGLKEWGPVDWLVGEVGMLKALNWTEHSRSAKLAEGMGPVDRLVGEVGMLKALNWAERSQRGQKEKVG